MPRFAVAHVKEQGVDLLIVPLDSSFQYKTAPEQRETVGELQVRANAAGLAGTVVPVWRIGTRMSFIAPRNWHPFFKGLSWKGVMGNLNKEIYW